MTDSSITTETGRFNFTGYAALLVVDLLPSVRQLLDDGQYQLAVVMAQAACEVRTEQVLTALIDKLEPPSLRDWVRTRAGRADDLADERTRKLYFALTGEEIKTGEGLWQQYAGNHVPRRHEVVHRGAKVSKEDATHSYETARQVIEHLTTMLKKLGGTR